MKTIYIPPPPKRRIWPLYVKDTAAAFGLILFVISALIGLGWIEFLLHLGTKK